MPTSVCRLALLLVGAASFSQVQAGPADACARHAAASKPAVNIRLDNDVFGAQDQGYSSGIQLMLVSSDLGAGGTGDDGIRGDSSGNDGFGDGDPEDSRPGPLSRAGDGCRWPLTDWLGRHLRFLAPAGSVQRNLTFSFAQAIFTPSNAKRTDLIPDDRPYAAALLVGLGHNARRDGRLHASLVQVGIVGPSARGEQAQNQIHKVTGDLPFLGWEHQLRDEAVFRLVHERLQRHLPRPTAAADKSWRWDAVSHWGASLGNLLTHANVGGEFRWGPQLPDDFGSSPTRPAGERTIGRRGEGDSAFATAPTGHAFVAADARWVLWDISLDGNAFNSSHSVDKESFVVDLGYGFAFTRGPWKIVVARFHRSREFRGQKDMPVFGSISVSRSF